MNPIDLTGRLFGRLLVIGLNGKRKRCYYWNCKCTCGTIKAVASTALSSKRVVSCGCWRIEKTIENRKTHGLSGSRVYRIWCKILERCRNPKSRIYHRYGGRGITVCDRWLKFDNFISDMGHDNGSEIDRINNDLGYEPGNCRWVNRSQNCRNKSNNHRVEFRGEVRCIVEWEEYLGFPKRTIKNRLRLGWTMDKALSTPINKNLSRNRTATNLCQV